MAEYVGFSLTYSADFTPENRRLFFTTLREAVRENFETHRDALSLPRSGGEDLDVDNLVAETDPEMLTAMVAEESSLTNRDWIMFVFGPVSQYCGLLSVARRKDKLCARIDVCDSEMYRNDDDRLRLRQELEPDFQDPRFLPEPSYYDQEHEDINDFVDRLEAVWEENGRRYDRFYRDRHQLWAVSAACLRHIFERLSAALPVARSRIDDELLTATGSD